MIFPIIWMTQLWSLDLTISIFNSKKWNKQKCFEMESGRKCRPPWRSIFFRGKYLSLFYSPRVKNTIVKWSKTFKTRIACNIETEIVMIFAYVVGWIIYCYLVILMKTVFSDILIFEIMELVQLRLCCQDKYNCWHHNHEQWEEGINLENKC